MNWQDILKDSGMDIDSGFGSDWTVHHMDTYKLQGVESDFNYAGLYSDIEFVFAQRDVDSLCNKSEQQYFAISFPDGVTFSNGQSVKQYLLTISR